MGKFVRITSKTGCFCDIVECPDVPGGSYCESGICYSRMVYERLSDIENKIQEGVIPYEPPETIQK